MLWHGPSPIIPCVSFCVLVMVVSATLEAEINGPMFESDEFNCVDGHYRPASSCIVGNIRLDANGTFSTASKPKLPQTKRRAFDKAMFSLETLERAADQSSCKQFVNRDAVFFSIYFHHGHGNFFHFFHDSVFPLFKTIAGVKTQRPVLFPFVEHGSLHGLPAGIAWDVKDVFSRSVQSFWMSLLQLLFADRSQNDLIPLDREFLNRVKTDGDVCFSRVRFGLASYTDDDASFLNQFRAHVFSRTEINPPLPVGTMTVPQLARYSIFVKRSKRRRILNRAELIRGVSDMLPMVRSISFENMSFHDQVKSLENCSLYIGMQGAGIINALYLPRGSAIVVLFQYMAASDSFSRLFERAEKGRHPYFRWVNRNVSNSVVQNEALDPFHDNADTIVDVREFRGIVKKAIHALDPTAQSRKREEL